MQRNIYSMSQAHVAVLAFPFGTHVAPLLVMTRRLATASADTIFSFISTQKSNRSNNHLHNLKPYDVSDGVPDGYVFRGKPQEAIELFLKSAPVDFRNAIKVAEADTGRNVSCLITDAFFWFAQQMAEEMEVPWVPFWTSGPTSLSVHLHTDLIRSKFSIAGACDHKDDTLSFLPGMSKMLISDLPEGIVFGNLESVFSRMLHQMAMALPQADAVCINSWEEIESAITNDLKSKFKRFLNVGPLYLLTSPPLSLPGDKHSCLTWLDNQNPASVAYISFGTVITPPPDELVALAEGLERSQVPFIWSLKDNAKPHLPCGFLDKTKLRGIVVPWVPQIQVLNHEAVGVFVTHCGWNSLLESIAGGVPMICRPFFGDQRLNGRTVEKVWKIGVEVEGGMFTSDGFMRCLDTILFQEKGKKMRKKIREVGLLAHEAVSSNGSSTANSMSMLELISTPKGKVKT